MKNPKIDQSRLDEALLADLKSGLPEAVELWYKQYHTIIYKYVLMKVSRSQDAQEVTRDVFLSCLQHLALFRGNCSIKTWMTTIANHEVADYFRRRYAKKFIHALPLSSYLFDETKVVKESSQLVVQVLEKMKKSYKELLLLKYIENISVKEIAHDLNKSIKSVESDLFRARKEFKHLYAMYDETNNS